jgi:hypothetical protein
MSTRGSFHPPDDQPPRFPAGRQLPHVLLYAAGQLAFFFVLLQVYKLARKAFIPPDSAIAYDHAKDVLHFEEKLGLMFELDLQRWVLDQGGWLIKGFNYFYAYYQWTFYACIIFLGIMAPARFRYMRRAYFISMAIATPMYLIYPLAPPRFMGNYGWPFVDALSVYGPNYFSDKGLVTANRFAAMPSMHVGWTTFAGLCLLLAVPWRKVGIALFALLTTAIVLTVMVTGNHYWLDAVGGWLVITAAFIINRLLPYPLPIRWPWQRERPATVAEQPAEATSTPL